MIKGPFCAQILAERLAELLGIFIGFRGSESYQDMLSSVLAKQSDLLLPPLFRMPLIGMCSSQL